MFFAAFRLFSMQFFEFYGKIVHSYVISTWLALFESNEDHHTYIIKAKNIILNVGKKRTKFSLPSQGSGECRRDVECNKHNAKNTALQLTLDMLERQCVVEKRVQLN